MKPREGYIPEQIRNKSFEEILDVLGSRQKDVYEIIQKWQPISNERIAEHLNVYPHQVTPRVLELRQMELIEFAGEGRSNANKKVSLWKLKKPGNQLTLFN